MGAFVLLLLSVATRVGVCNEVPEAAAIRKLWSERFTPVPKEGVAPTAKKEVIELGRQLFFERALSPDRTRSCNDCHDLSKHGTNGEVAVALRTAGTLKRDVPSIYNLSGLKLMCWDGLKVDLQARIADAITNPVECGMPDSKAVVDRLAKEPDYNERFKAAFGDKPVSMETVSEALHAYVQGLVTRAPIDDFVLGNDKALSADQLKGAHLFEEKNCSSCHTGSAIGGQMVQVAGIAVPWPNQTDTGYFAVTGNPDFKMGFRVPPLRNVAATAPYFHDYSARTLRKAIREIALHEQGMHLEIEEILLLEAFLESFTGELPADYIKPPKTAPEKK